MTTEAHPDLQTQLDTIRSGLENRIRDKNGDKNSLDAFIPFADLREILDRNTIHKLFRCYGRTNDIRPTATRRCASQYLKVLATLIHIYNDKSLSKVVRYIKGHRNSHDSWEPPSDDELPVNLEAAQCCFGKQEGYSFFVGQFVFCALVIREDRDYQISVHDRLLFPFVSEEFKDEGTVGAVFQVKLARGHWLDRNGVSNNDYEKELAQKRFAKRNKEKFHDELEKLKELRRSARFHKNINLHLASLDVGSNYSMFYELAEKDLDEFLLEPATPARWEWWQKAAFMENTTDVLDALAWLHNFRPDCAVYHFDISPKNILIFKGSRESAYIKEPHHERQTVWKLSDFDLSEFKYTKFLSSTSREDWNRSGTSSVSYTLEPSSYRAPEVFDGSKIGPESDVWSFACIFSLVLSYLHDGGKGVYDFHKAMLRETPSGNRKWDYFFDPASVPGQPIRIHPSVKEWFEMIKEKQECPYHHEYVKQVTGSLVSEIFDKPEKSERLKAASLYSILWSSFKEFCDRHQRKGSLTDRSHHRVRRDNLRRSGRTESNASNGTDRLPDSRPGSSTSLVYRVSSGSTSVTSSTTPPSAPRRPPSTQSVVSDDNPPAQPPIVEEDPSANQSFPGRPKCADFADFCKTPNSDTLSAFLDSEAIHHMTKKCRFCNYTPLERAAECSDPEILRRMVQEACAPPINLNLDFKCETGLTLFMKCCIEKWWESAIVLKNNGATTDRKSLKKMGIPSKYKKALL